MLQPLIMWLYELCSVALQENEGFGHLVARSQAQMQGLMHLHKAASQAEQSVLQSLPKITLWRSTQCLISFAK